MKYFWKPIVFISMGVIINACADREISSKAKDDAFPATFSAVRDRILIPHCASCHELVGSYKFVTDAFVGSPGNAEASELYEVVASGEMPISYELLDEEKAAIKAWIDKGAPND